ncbi:MAG: ATP phosphoribosyltransferase [Planctomycetota bacterium]|jgi:ATP phosphoribosyltransferase
MIQETLDTVVHLALPKGRMQQGVQELLAQAGIRVSTDARGYRPSLSIPGFETKLLKPQNIVEMLGAGSRDFGFAGADWVAEKGVRVIELLDTELDPVRLVAAAPPGLVESGLAAGSNLVVASEYETLARNWMSANGVQGSFLRTYGATEVFPPEDADLVIDNCASGATLRANNLLIVDEIMCSSTRLYACPKALEDPAKRERIEDFVLSLRSVVQARGRAMLDLNVSSAELDAVISALSCMREPTISGLHGQGGYAVRAAVERKALPGMIPLLKARGATDIVISRCEQIVP